MEKRGGGILDFELLDMRDRLENYYQINITFETVDSMGANFINSCLEESAKTLQEFIKTYPVFEGAEKELGHGLHGFQDLYAHSQLKTMDHAIIGKYPDIVEYNPIAFQEVTEGTAAYLLKYLREVEG